MRRYPVLIPAALLVASLAAPVRAQGLEPAASPAGPGTSTGAQATASGPDAAVADASAARDPALYSAEVELLSQGPGERRAAAARALAQVVVKLSGDPQAASNPVVRRALGQAEAYVVASGEAGASDAPGNTAIGGVPVLRARMAYQFDPGRVDALIAGAGLPFWGSARPQPLLWLAIDDGRGPRLVSAQQINVVKPLATRGLERGLRFALPAGSAVEAAAVQTIWSQNAAPLAPLAARYGNDVQLLGKVQRGGGGWTADWLLVRGDAELARWSFSDPSPQRVIASGADGAADAIARRDAVPMTAGTPEQRVVEVTGLRSAEDLARAMGYLQTLPVVRGLQVLEARPEGLRLQLDLAVGLPAFQAFVAAGDTLQADPLAPEDAPRLQLRP